MKCSDHCPSHPRQVLYLLSHCTILFPFTLVGYMGSWPHAGSRYLRHSSQSWLQNLLAISVSAFLATYMSYCLNLWIKELNALFFLQTRIQASVIMPKYTITSIVQSHRPASYCAVHFCSLRSTLSVLAVSHTLNQIWRNSLV
jgi:hypothetical protein